VFQSLPVATVVCMQTPLQTFVKECVALKSSVNSTVVPW